MSSTKNTSLRIAVNELSKALVFSLGEKTDCANAIANIMDTVNVIEQKLTGTFIDEINLASAKDNLESFAPNQESSIERNITANV